jgi:SulP family sulfate permease
VADQVGRAGFWALGIAAGVLSLVVVAERLDRRLPGALAGVVGATALVASTDLVRHGVRVVGEVHVRFPRLGWPGTGFSQVGRLAESALTVAFLCVVQTSATARANQVEGRGARDFDLDLVGVGAGSVLAGLAGSFAVDASPPALPSPARREPSRSSRGW